MPGRMPMIGRAIALAVLLACAPAVTMAQSIIRDAEIERALQELAAPFSAWSACRRARG